MTKTEELLLEYSKDMAAAQPLDRRVITRGYARILELREHAARIDELELEQKSGYLAKRSRRIEEMKDFLTNHNSPKG